MKKLAILAAVAMVMAFVTAGWASPPVPPPKEGFVITSTTAIECLGTVTETEDYDWTYYAVEDPTRPLEGNPVPIQDPENPDAILGADQAAQIRYTEDFVALNGFTQFNKSLGATTYPTDENPNLEVQKNVGYIAFTDDPLAEATMVERVGMNVVATGDVLRAGFAGLLSLCPMGVTEAEANLPATNEAIAAGNTFKVTALQNWSSNSQVTTTALPELQMAVSATLAAEGSFAGIGSIGTTFIVQVLEGVGQGSAGVPTISEVNYSDSSTAAGVWNFEKFMAYNSAINPRILPSFPTPFGSLPETP